MDAAQKVTRKGNRLKGHDYSRAGYYFVTICTKNRECRFGDVEEGNMFPNETGRSVSEHWQSIPQYYADVQLDKYVIMPNHLHGIIIISCPTAGAITNRLEPAGQEIKRALDNRPCGLLSNIIKSFKQVSTKKIRRNNPDFAWQRSFYDRVIQDCDELSRVREYINNNPLKWSLDKDNPVNWTEG